MLRGVDGVDVDAALAAIDTPAVEEAYQHDRAEALQRCRLAHTSYRTSATTDGPVRYTAPSLVFERAGRRLEAGGWQTIEAYDVIVANLIPDGERRGVPDDPGELLTAFPDGLTTQRSHNSSRAATTLPTGRGRGDNAGARRRRGRDTHTAGRRRALEADLVPATHEHAVRLAGQFLSRLLVRRRPPGSVLVPPARRPLGRPPGWLPELSNLVEERTSSGAAVAQGKDIREALFGQGAERSMARKLGLRCGGAREAAEKAGSLAGRSERRWMLGRQFVEDGSV